MNVNTTDATTGATALLLLTCEETYLSRQMRHPVLRHCHCPLRIMQLPFMSRVCVSRLLRCRGSRDTHTDARSPIFSLRGEIRIPVPPKSLTRLQQVAMKVIIICLGTRGDVEPLLALGKALLARGHAVTLCGPDNCEQWVRDEHGVAFAPMGLDF